MSDSTPPTGGILRSTHEPNPGDRIAGALLALERTPPPGWLWALWVSSLPAGRRDPLAGAIPPDAGIIRMGEGVGFDTSPPHYGMVSRDALPAYGQDGAKGPEMFAGYLVRMFATASAPERCLCGVCTSTGMPPGLVEYLAAEAVAPMDWPPFHPNAGRDPGGSIRFTLALEVAAARAMREHYIYVLHHGGAPAGWLAQATDPEYPGHYMARMSDTGLAVGMCSVMWCEPMLEAGLPHLYPVEMYAALAAGFSYPVPTPFSEDWHVQEEAEQTGMGPWPSCEILRNTAEDLAGLLDDGWPPWDGSNTGPCEVSP
jgi:hypothetical protein